MVEDRAKKEQLWSKLAEAWFPDGADDPDLALVEVRIEDAEYWDVKESKVTQLFKMARAAVVERPAERDGRARRGAHGPRAGRLTQPAAAVRCHVRCYTPPSAVTRPSPFRAMKTYTAKPGEIQRDWYLVDAEGKTLGRLATQIADTLRGKGKPLYTPHVDTGDFVIVVNAEKIHVTGKKLDEKMVYRHSGYPGGLKERTLREQLERRPTEVIRKAVKGMLPKNKLAAAQLRKLKVYAGPEHPHAAQAPKELELSHG